MQRNFRECNYCCNPFIESSERVKNGQYLLLHYYPRDSRTPLLYWYFLKLCVDSSAKFISFYLFYATDEFPGYLLIRAFTNIV